MRRAFDLSLSVPTMRASHTDNPKTAAFLLDGEMQYVEVQGNDYPAQKLWRRIRGSGIVADEMSCPVARCGCAIDDIAASPSGNWLVSQRISGGGEWGYDVFRSCPLRREAGILSEPGIILDLPKFSKDESRIVGGFGLRWLGGWWAHPEDEFEDPARGGVVTLGFLFVHHLPRHTVRRHELQMDLPAGWLPAEPEAEKWYGARDITPKKESVKLVLPGGVPFEINEPLPPIILLPTPHPSGGRLIKGWRRRRS
jgi:hypothetical protein